MLFILSCQIVVTPGTAAHNSIPQEQAQPSDDEKLNHLTEDGILG